KTYTVTVTRAAPLSTNANLSNLVLSQGTLTPAFASAITSYTASVPNSVSSITVTPIASDANSTITVNGSAVVSGTPSPAIPLVVGANAIIISVPTRRSSDLKTYTVTVTRAAPLSTNADLSNLVLSQGTLTPAFASAITSYTASVANSVSS